MKKESALKGLGVFFIFVGILSIATAVREGRFEEVIWVCYAGTLLMGLGFLFGWRGIARAQMNILFIIWVLWTVDALLFLFGIEWLGISSYLFLNRGAVLTFISLQHIYGLVLGILGIWLMGSDGANRVKKKESEGVKSGSKGDREGWGSAWKLSLIEMGLIFILSRLFTPVERNLNCVFRSCISGVLEGISVAGWVLVWVAVVIVGVLFVDYGFRRLF